MSEYRNRIFLGSCESMAEIEDGSVQCCVTSPPYWGLRSYHGGERLIGLEDTPEQWCERLVAVFREVRRVLRDDGTLWLNLGDAYFGDSPVRTRGQEAFSETWDLSQTRSRGGSRRSAARVGDLKPKDLCGLPWMLAFALRADGWYLRSDIIWHKPNPMPSSVEDRCTSSHECVFMLAKSRRYFFDADAIREPLADSSIKRIGQATFDSQNGGAKAAEYENQSNNARRAVENLKARYGRGAMPGFDGTKGAGDAKNERSRNGQPWNPPGRNSRMFVDRDPMHLSELEAARKMGRRTTFGNQGEQVHPEGVDHTLGDPWLGANKRDVWSIPTSGFPGAHFATFPEELVRLCILAGTSAAGQCAACGSPYARDRAVEYDNPGNRTTNGPRYVGREEAPGRDVRLEKRVQTLGWESTCACDAGTAPQLVLDPFMGSGTTAAVAIGCGRDFTGYEISPEYHHLIEERLGLFYTPAERV